MPVNARLLIAAAALAATLVLAASAGAVTIGIADQKPDMFGDKRFEKTGVRHARLSIAWDALSHPWQQAELDRWLGAAHRAGVEPLISFGHSRVHRRQLPSPERFLYEFRRFRARYPWVRDFATWNEANHCGEPTCHRASLVAGYYRKLRSECTRCRILAAELLDMPNMVSWVREFRRAAMVEPKIWGLHNYVDTNRLRTTSTRALLGATRGQIWLTETGGIVSRKNRRKVTFEESPRHAALAMRWLFDRLVPMSGRITRVYLYHWNAGARGENWDSALIDRLGRPRPAFRVLERELTLQRAEDAILGGLRAE